MVVRLQPFFSFAAIFLVKKHKMTLKTALNSNILNNKGTQTSFSVQILSTFTFPRRNRVSFSHNPHIFCLKFHIFAILKDEGIILKEVK